MHIKKGDTVIVMTGKDRGKSGVVARAMPHEERIIIEGVNMQKKHRRSRKERGKGQIVPVAMPIHVSNVMLKDPKTGKPTRVGFKRDGEKKVRVAKKSGVEL